MKDGIFCTGAVTTLAGVGYFSVGAAAILAGVIMMAAAVLWHLGRRRNRGDDQ